MNQKLGHGMTVRAKHKIYGVEDRGYKWDTSERDVVVTATGSVFIGGVQAFGDGVHDYTDLFDIIPDPMTAEEAMAAIVEWERNTNSATRLIEIIDEYKKGRE